MDAIVTARVPIAVKEQGNAVLREIGSTPTELINAAYRYVLATHELPMEEAKLHRGARRLTPEQRAKLAKRAEIMTQAGAAAASLADVEA